MTEIPLTIAAWTGAIAGAAAALKALGWIWRTSILPSWHTMRRAVEAIMRLAAIGDAASWPNGSTDLPTFLHGIHSLLNNHLDAHERAKREAQAAEIDRAAGVERWADHERDHAADRP